MMGGRRGGTGGSDRPAPEPQNDVERAAQELQRVLQNQDASSQQIQTALSGYRQARNRARAELEVAQKELREVVTVRQEAQLVAIGLLD